MATLLHTADVTALVQTTLSEDDLQAVIDREEAELIRRFGPHADGTTPITETFLVTGAEVFTSRPIASLSSIAVVAYVGAAPSTLQTAQYYQVPPLNQIRIAPFLREAFVTVTYIPKDDRSIRKAVLIDLIRLTLEQPIYSAGGRVRRITSDGDSVEYEHYQGGPALQAAREAAYGRLQLVPTV